GLELAAILADPSRNRPLDFVIAPGADALGLAGGDVARHRDAPRAGKFKTSGAQTTPLPRALIHGRMAFHAMRDCDEIKAFLHHVAHHAFGELRLTAGNHNLKLGHLVDRVRDFVAHWLQGAQIGDDRVEIAIGHHVIEACRHDHRHMYIVRPDTGAHKRLELCVAPRADAGLLVGRYVRTGDLEWRLV